MDFWNEWLDAQPFLVLDGGLATELEARRVSLDDPLWSAAVLVEKPELIREVHLDYLRAGADVLITASYQASFEGFTKRGLPKEQAASIMRRSVELACEARDRFWSDPFNRKGRRRPLVAASVGPYGAFLADGSEYRGDYGLTRKELMDWHRPRLQVLAAAGPDLLACETIPCLAEGEALVELLQEFPSMRAWLSFSGADNRHLPHGERFVEAVALASESEQIVAVGVNCTPPDRIAGLLESAAGITNKPFVVYPNSGESWDPENRCWIPVEGSQPYRLLVREWYDRGARLIGGCCRTTPTDIRTIREGPEFALLPYASFY